MTMGSSQGAKMAYESLNGVVLGGRQITVNAATPRKYPPKSPRTPKTPKTPASGAGTGKTPTTLQNKNFFQFF